MAHPPQIIAAAALLRDWAETAGPDALAALGLPRALSRYGANDEGLVREYDEEFEPGAAYLAAMPDLQNGPASLIRGAETPIQHVGISNFRVPVRYRLRKGGSQVFETSVTGTVRLDAQKKGINMSRIMRSFYKQLDRAFSFDVMEEAVADYLTDLSSAEARIQMRLSYPVEVRSLRSGLMGYQYYDLTLEMVGNGQDRQRFMHLDYVYSSTCPCSLELSEHARSARGRLASPHSQRSVARISVKMEGAKRLWFEDLIELCRRAVPTETQVMVKREDEQAFGELNAANPIFVEDAVRLFAEQLQQDPRISDFRVIASHQESLHSHDAVSLITQGESFADQQIDPRLFASLTHPSRA